MGTKSNTRFTDKQRAFVRHYVDCLNATEAAKRAGYSEKTAQQMGSENLSKPVIRDAIDDALGEIVMTKNEVLRRLGKLATEDDNVRALELLGKYYALFTDNMNHRTPDGPLVMLTGVIPNAPEGGEGEHE